MTLVANLAFFIFFEVLRPNTWLIFHIHMFLVPLYNIRCQSGPSGDFGDECDAVPYRNAMRHKYSSINCNSAPFCSEMNKKYAGERFMSLRFIVFEIYAYKVKKKCRFCENLTLDRP